jgi:hypothetical protein
MYLEGFAAKRSAIYELIFFYPVNLELQNFQLNRTILESIQKNLSSILLRLKRRYSSSPKFVPIGQF